MNLDDLRNPGADCHDVGECFRRMREAADEIERLQRAAEAWAIVQRRHWFPYWMRGQGEGEYWQLYAGDGIGVVKAPDPITAVMVAEAEAKKLETSCD